MRINRAIPVVLGVLIGLSSTVIMAADHQEYDSKLDTNIEGKDLDNDGVRDDVQRYINERYSGYPILRGEMRRYSIALHDLMMSKGVAQAMNATKAMDAAKYCAIAWGYSEEEFIRHSSVIYSMQVNTRRRILATAKAERSLMGASIIPLRTRPYASYCEQSPNLNSNAN